MYDIRQFWPTLYVLLMLGVTGFSLAAEAPGLWIMAAGGIMLNGWLVKTGRFTPIPRFLANIITLGAFGLVSLEVHAGGTAPILMIGQFIVFLHLVKLFEARANRDYAQLLILSLLLMVAAAISTASLLFGIIFIVYMFLSLHCSLLFHLKVEMDQARELYRQPQDRVNPALLRQDARDLPRSMRRLTGLISIVGITTAVLVFLFFPRGAGQSILGPLQAPASRALSGFNDQVGFQNIAKITRSNDVVARVELYDRDVKVTHPMELLLRGSALDVYTGNDLERGRWQWERSQVLDRFDDEGETGQEDATRSLYSTGAPGRWKQVINLQPTATNKLFAIAGATDISSSHEMEIHFSEADGVLESAPPVLEPVTYTVKSTGQLPMPEAAPQELTERSAIDPAIAAYVRQPNVCGTDARGQPMAQYPLSGNHSYDYEIAAHIEQHLRTNFAYSLDLTNLGSLGDRDPLAAFLTDFKRGHCEYFAGAMTLMCQSLGIPARMVVGFRCEPEDFNTMGDYFVVKQSNAHAWCEVFTGSKWETFDPTSGRGTGDITGHELVKEVKQLVDYLEFKWAVSVVAYDTGNRKNFIDGLDIAMSKTAVSGSQNLQDWIDGFQKQIASPTALSGVIAGMITLMFVLVGWFLVERWRLHRRARRIGIGSIDSAEQLRLVRQLGFYDDLLRLLSKYQIERPRYQTPLEFSQSLAYLPSDVYRDIHRLTQVFYRIRYGGAKLPSHPRRHLSTAVYRIQQSLEQMQYQAQ
jgi:transglutaminase-like putative cysteine protease